MAKPQISTRVSVQTRQQANWLRSEFAYSLRDVVTVAIDRFYQQMKKEHPVTRKLTETEVDAFPGQSSVDVAIHSTDGNWYYGDSNPTQDDPSGLSEAQFVMDEDGYYIPVKH